MESIRFRCPECQQSLKVAAAKAGRKVRCNRCAKVLTVPAEGEEPEDRLPGAHQQPTKTLPNQREGREPEEGEDGPDEEDGDEPRKRKPKRQRRAAAWRLARLGVLVLLIGGALALLNGAASSLLFVVPMGTTAGALRLATFLIWAGVGAAVLFGVINVAGFALCAFAPAESGARPFALLALVTTLLSSAMSAYLVTGQLSPAGTRFAGYDFSDPKEVERYMKEQQERMRDPKELQKYLREWKEESDRMMEDLRSHMRWLSVRRTVGSLLNGLALISVPLLLRAFCRALGLGELEPNCDGLLKIGAGLIALDLATRMTGVVLLALAAPVGCLSGMLGFAYQVLALMLLFQVWRALPAPR